MSTKTKPATRPDIGVQFNCAPEDHRTIAKIAQRAVAMNPDYDFRTADMDVTACHCNGTPLRLTALLGADAFNFAHDVFGIARHIDRETGRLAGCFVPRFAVPNYDRGMEES